MRSLLNWLSQISMVTRFSLKGIPERKGAAAAAAFGIACVVAVLVAVLSIGAGFRHAITAAGSPSRAIILRSGSTSEMMSSLSQEDSTVIADGPGIVHDGGAPEVSSELYLVINLPKRSTGTDANVPLRGVGEMAYKIRDEVKIVEGRRFTPGRNEVIVGQSAAREFSGLNVGGKIKVGGSYWDVVGVFTANGGVCESEIWGDAGVLQSAFNRGSSFQMMCVKLTSPSAFASFTNSVMSDPRIKI